MHRSFVVTLAIVAVIGSNSNALAGGSTPVVTNVVRQPGEPPLVSLGMKHRGPLVARNEAEDAGLVKIANNLTAYPKSPYWGYYGYASCGLGSCASGTEQWLATAFTPKANHLATRVEIPAAYYSGTSEVVLSLYDDSHGVPGKALHSWTITNLPRGVCCTLIGGSDKRGIALSGGKQYWVVLGTSPKEPSAVAVWTLTEYAGVQKHGASWAVYCSGSGCAGLGLEDNGWHIFTQVLYGLAFSVLGQ